MILVLVLWGHNASLAVDSCILILQHLNAWRCVQMEHMEIVRLIFALFVTALARLALAQAAPNVSLAPCSCTSSLYLRNVFQTAISINTSLQLQLLSV